MSAWFDLNRRNILQAVCGSVAASIGLGIGSVSGESGSEPDPGEYDNILDEMDGDGTETDPYVITDVRELQAVNGDTSAEYKLGGDIDATITSSWNNGAGFEPLELNFSTTFDGQGYTITGLFIDRPESEVALFGVLSGSTIKNVTLQNVDITGTGEQMVGGAVGRATSDSWISNVTIDGGSVTASGHRVGMLAGRINNDTTVSQCTAHGTVRGDRRVGGLIGQASNDGEISECEAQVDVSQNEDPDDSGQFGGLVGDTQSLARISDSIATGDVSGDNEVGGLVGQQFGTIEDSEAHGRVEATDGIAGGLTGSNWEKTIDQSYSTGIVTSNNGSAGGLVGRNGGAVSRCYASGEVDGHQSVGGLAARNTGTVRDSYATGFVTAGESAFGGGGLIGITDNEAAIRRSFSVGGVTGPNDRTGGLLGRDFSDVVVEASYWDRDTSGQDESVGSPTENGLPTEDMQGEAAISNLTGFNFDTVWAAATDPDDYPELRVDDPPVFFTVEITDLPSFSDVPANEPLTVPVTVRNIGSETGTQTVELLEPVYDRKDIELAPGEEQSVEFTVPAEALSDFVPIIVGSERDSDVVVVRAPNPSVSFGVEIQDPADGAEVTEGEDLDVTAEVTNVGSESGTQAVTVTEPIKETNEAVEINSGETEELVFTIPGSELDGTVTITVETEDDTDSISVTAVDPCFIATAAYDTPLASEIDVLREFRDDILNQSGIGRLAVRIYYQTSPPVANWIRKSRRRRAIVRTYFVDPIVRVVRSLRSTSK